MTALNTQTRNGFTVATMQAVSVVILTSALMLTSCSKNGASETFDEATKAIPNLEPAVEIETLEIEIPSEIESSGYTEEAALTKDYAELCDAINYPSEGSEILDVQNYYVSQLRKFRRNYSKVKFGGSLYSTEVDYDGDGVKDYYLTIPGYHYSSFREDYTELYIVPGVSWKSEISHASFASDPLKRILFVNLLKDTFVKRSGTNLALEDKFIKTAKVTPIKFKNEIYLKVEAQLATGLNQVYRSAYHNPPDFTTYAKINHLMELEPIC